jgi:hypothetical protein
MIGEVERLYEVYRRTRKDADFAAWMNSIPGGLRFNRRGEMTTPLPSYEARMIVHDVVAAATGSSEMAFAREGA